MGPSNLHLEGRECGTTTSSRLPNWAGVALIQGVQGQTFDNPRLATVTKHSHLILNHSIEASICNAYAELYHVEFLKFENNIRRLFYSSVGCIEFERVFQD